VKFVGTLVVLCVAFASAPVFDVHMIFAQTSSWLQIVAIILLVAALSCGRESVPWIVQQVSEATFAIYLFHIFFLVWAQPFLPHAKGFLDPFVVAAQFAAGLLDAIVLITLGRIVFGRHSRTILGA
jgi:peptidoglycan/LPS O-acetylase OafA/YrhL